jgi:hypothetical protein
MTKGSNTTGQVRHGKALLAWQLALLRFAVTTDDADRLALLAIAGELDAPGGRASHRPPFQFFRQASGALCHAIANPQHPGSVAMLRQHLARTDDKRLRRALAAVLGLDHPETGRAKMSPHPDRDLWRGLKSSTDRKRA